MSSGEAAIGSTIEKGALFGRYVVDELLGAGGMAAVYRAHHVDLGRTVALKIMHGSLSSSEAHVRRFMQEARSVASLSHPNIAAVMDVGEVDDRPYLVMEYLEGETLAELVARTGRMSTTAIADLMLPLVSAIATAHAAGIVHRDIKPENIFLARDPRGPERPVLLDFGISKQVQTPKAKALTEAGQFVGTPYYMSPEQIQMNVPLDGRSDEYALGVVLYELSTGLLPFRSDQSLYVLLAEIVLGDVEPPSLLEPSIPRAFERVTLRAMAAAPDDRYPTITALGQALLPFASPDVQSVWAAELGPALKQDSLSPPKGTPSWRGKVARPPLRTSLTLDVGDLRVVKGLDTCSDAELAAFLLAVGTYKYPAGSRLFDQGEEANGCFVVLRGEVEVVKEALGRTTLLSVIGAGELIGQMALVEDAPRSASVVARTDANVLCIGRDVFERLLSSGSPIAERLQLLLAVSGIRQLRAATRRLSALLEERSAGQMDAQAERERKQHLERLRAAISEWSVAIDALP